MQKAFQRWVARLYTTKPRKSHNLEILTFFDIFQVVLPNTCGFSLRANGGSNLQIRHFGADIGPRISNLSLQIAWLRFEILGQLQKRPCRPQTVGLARFETILS